MFQGEIVAPTYLKDQWLYFWDTNLFRALSRSKKEQKKKAGRNNEGDVLYLSASQRNLFPSSA